MLLKNRDFLYYWFWELLAWDLLNGLHLVLRISVPDISIPLALNGFFAGNYLDRVMIER